MGWKEAAKLVRDVVRHGWGQTARLCVVLLVAGGASAVFLAAFVAVRMILESVTTVITTIA